MSAIYTLNSLPMPPCMRMRLKLNSHPYTGIGACKTQIYLHGRKFYLIMVTVIFICIHRGMYEMNNADFIRTYPMCLTGAVSRGTDCQINHRVYGLTAGHCHRCAW